MTQEKIVVGFAGAGRIARTHIYALNSLRFYYDDLPEIEFESVCSGSVAGREKFAEKFGFQRSEEPDSFLQNEKLNTIFILGPNKVHFHYLASALKMPSVNRIYLEKPICSTAEEEEKILAVVENHPGKKIQVGFQYLFSTQIIGALSLWKSGILGNPIHFDIKYYHGDYLRREYRDKRASRLTPAPDGGAMADLGSHAISLLVAFLGNRIKVLNALQAGNFSDVADNSDLFSLITIYDPATKSVGTLSSSRISSGTGDMISFELYAEKGALKFTTHEPDCFEYYLEADGVWKKLLTGSNYEPFSTFPSGHVPPGWLRSMVHGHYVFLTGNNRGTIVPDIFHGIDVQRIIRTAATGMQEFREMTSFSL